MSRAWFFQTNPTVYDIDGALARLDHIWWRVPQYASEICVADLAHRREVATEWRTVAETFAGCLMVTNSVH
jgi:hypothetical protein